MGGMNDPTAWERLWPLLVTAGLSLIVLAVVQLVIVPRLELRKRREQRWETDLLALGEFLTFEYQQALDEYVKALQLGAMLSEIGPGGLRQDHERDAWVGYHDMRRAAVDPYGRACSRLDWLAERVASLDRAHPRLWRLWTACVQANLALDSVDPRYRMDADSLASSEAVGDAAREARRHVKLAVEQVKYLAGQQPPSPPSRPRQFLRNAWRRFRNRRKNRSSARGSNTTVGKV